MVVRNSGNDSSGPDPLNARLHRHLVVARWGMAFERLWPAIWPAVGVTGFYIAFSLFDPWTQLPIWIHLLALVSCLGAAFFIIRRALTDIDWPTNSDASRLLENSPTLNTARWTCWTKPIPLRGPWVVRYGRCTVGGQFKTLRGSGQGPRRQACNFVTPGP